MLDLMLIWQTTRLNITLEPALMVGISSDDI